MKKWDEKQWLILILGLCLLIPITGAVITWFVFPEAETDDSIWEKLMLAILAIIGMYLGIKKEHNGN